MIYKHYMSLLDHNFIFEKKNENDNVHLAAYIRERLVSLFIEL